MLDKFFGFAHKGPTMVHLKLLIAGYPEMAPHWPSSFLNVGDSPQNANSGPQIHCLLGFADFGPKYLGPHIFRDMRFVAVNSKYGLVSHIFELGIFNEGFKREPKMY